MLCFGGFSFLFLGKRTRDFAFISSCYGRRGEEIGMGYAMAASGQVQYDYKQTNCPNAEHTNMALKPETGSTNDAARPQR